MLSHLFFLSFIFDVKKLHMLSKDSKIFVLIKFDGAISKWRPFFNKFTLLSDWQYFDKFVITLSFLNDNTSFFNIFCKFLWWIFTMELTTSWQFLCTVLFKINRKKSTDAKIKERLYLITSNFLSILDAIFLFCLSYF